VSFKSSGSGRRSKLVTRKGVHVVAVCNLTPVPRHGYRIGVPRRCDYLELLNTDARDYGGSGVGNLGRVVIEDVPSHGFAQSVVLALPPLATLWLVPELDEDPRSIEPESTDGDVLIAEASPGGGAGAPKPQPSAGAIFEAAVEGVPAAAADQADQRAARERDDRSIRDESTLVSFDRRGAS